ncbi:MAG: dethiobiotin synthase [Deltaproteobacteria bacterium]|nr:dethiobiotin synthase [Nannocystaceae bacterium]
MSCPRVFLVGTDTGVGKTAIACALLHGAHALGVRVLPYKPVQSSASDEPLDDAARLLAASANPDLRAEEICALRFDVPLAPGLADDPSRFLEPAPSRDRAPLMRCRDALAQHATRHDPQLVLIEGAGGLWVPMPGGTWQPEWILALASHVVVVGRAGLGAINAALLTIDALRAIDLDPVGFYLSETAPPDPSNAHNAAVIARARALPHLGTLRHHGDDELFSALLERTTSTR